MDDRSFLAWMSARLVSVYGLAASDPDVDRLVELSQRMPSGDRTSNLSSPPTPLGDDGAFLASLANRIVAEFGVNSRTDFILKLRNIAGACAAVALKGKAQP